MCLRGVVCCGMTSNVSVMTKGRKGMTRLQRRNTGIPGQTIESAIDWSGVSDSSSLALGWMLSYFNIIFAVRKRRRYCAVAFFDACLLEARSAGP